MKGAVKVQVVGLDKALRALQDVEKKVRNRAARKAMDAADKIVLAAQRSLVPVESGLLKKSLGKKVKVFRGSGTVVGIVGPRKGFKTFVVKTDRGAAIAGTAKSVGLLRKAKGAAVGVEIRDPAKYAHLANMHKQFVEPSIDNNRAAVVAAMGNVIAAEIAKA
jgi:HK97 gp10 family phage protein